MPLPLVVWGIGIAATALYGTSKAVDGYNDSCEADSVQCESEEILKEANFSLENAKKRTMNMLENFGRKKLTIWGKQIKQFIEFFSQIRNVEFEGKIEGEKSGFLSKNEIVEMKAISYNASELVSGGAASLGAGALAGIGAFGGAVTLGAASTGTAIGTLTGIAAHNATLAWFGGGALSAGGAGMAGGAMVLGGLVTAPILAVGGWFYSEKSKEKLAIAKSNRSEARKLKAEMGKIETALEGITKIVNQYSSFLQKLADEQEKLNARIRRLVNRHGNDYQTYPQKDKEFLYASVQFVSLLKNLLVQKILNDDGQLIQGVSDSLTKAKREQLKLERTFE